MIVKLKSIGSLIKSFVILVDVSDLSFLLMLDSENDKNVIIFNLIPKDENFSYNGVLLVY